MTISYGHLDDLLGQSFTGSALSEIQITSGKADGASGIVAASLVSVTGTPVADPYSSVSQITVRAVNDANNSLVLNISNVSFTYYVLGSNGGSLFLSGIANYGPVLATGILDGSYPQANPLFVALSLNGQDLGASPVGTSLTWEALAQPALTVTDALQGFKDGSISASNRPVITDSAANVQTNIDAMETYISRYSVIDLTDANTPTLVVTASQLSSDSLALETISTPYNLEVTGSWSNLVALQVTAGKAAGAQLVTVTVDDASYNVSTSLDQLQTQAAAGTLVGITLNDGGIPTLSITDAQLGTDAKAIADISGYFTLVESAPTTTSTVAGAANALGNTMVFNGDAGDYTIKASGDGTHFTVAGNGMTDTFSNIQALKFADLTLIVAQTPSADAVTTGNITELYGAVFGREPDVPGLAYYQQQLAANPATPLTTFALNFLSSPEYMNNSAHNYAQTTAGDTQFITDLYNNLLHRAPEAGAADWYETNVINKIVGSATPGTAAYTAALAAAHAAVVVGFSQSTEFLNDVQVTASNPAGAQHWLILI